MKEYTNRLQVLERFFCVKSIPTFAQFKTKWAETDSLSKSVIAALAESGDFEAVRKPWEKYMLAVRGYLLQMGEIEPDAQSLRQLAAEMEGGMLMKTILDRLQAMERLMPSLVTVTYPDGTQTVVEALRAFEIAVNNRNATFSVPNNQAMETLLRAVADAVGT